MIIQGLNNIASAYGATYKSAVERQTSPAPEANYADKVSISDAGKAMTKVEAESPSQEFRRAAIEDAKQDPAFAEKVARQYAYDDSLEKGGPLVDISSYPTMRYTYTGELVTDENMTEFKAEAGNARKDRIALYQSEKSQGTSDVEILEKLFRSTDTQPDSYLSKIGWERANSIAARI